MEAGDIKREADRKGRGNPLLAVYRWIISRAARFYLAVILQGYFFLVVLAMVMTASFWPLRQLGLEPPRSLDLLLPVIPVVYILLRFWLRRHGRVCGLLVGMAVVVVLTSIPPLYCRSLTERIPLVRTPTQDDMQEFRLATEMHLMMRWESVVRKSIMIPAGERGSAARQCLERLGLIKPRGKQD